MNINNMRQIKVIAAGGQSTISIVEIDGLQYAYKKARQDDYIPIIQREGLLLIRLFQEHSLPVVRVHFVMPDGYIMDIYEKTLSNVIKKEEYLSERPEIAYRLLSVFKQLADIGVYHRDIKPDNILMNGSIPYICDFGMSVDENGTRNTITGNVGGTFLYIDPNLIIKRSSFKNDPFPVDQFALGQTFKQLMMDIDDISPYEYCLDRMTLTNPSARFKSYENIISEFEIAMRISATRSSETNVE